MVENLLFIVTDNEGIKHTYYDREYAYNCYENCGTKLETKTKSLIPVYETIIEEPNFNLERIREDLTIKETTEARRKANKKYDSANCKGYYIKLNRNTDAKIIEYLEREDIQVQTLFKELVLERIANEMN